MQAISYLVGLFLTDPTKRKGVALRSTGKKRRAGDKKRGGLEIQPASRLYSSCNRLLEVTATDRLVGVEVRVGRTFNVRIRSNRRSDDQGSGGVFGEVFVR